ncbi:MerR family transcriptional regulator [Plantactinospora soyae]|uniref:DNA-binding transcriptional MerR regulator n=1 Tax=Plantactinospora soyae TaxID=1544732 RepID=A0A927M6A1_9ACTN|nr:MerR family transcriptional regulator [Plantactinospora soyae]MBE1487526.1 DNA-binding transcriptional MerR regulator [Plantactinospora soyae]
MRISDLSRRTGVPVATIKFYLRRGLLPRGVPTQRNQAEYGERHLHLIRLIRAFTNIGQLDLSTVGELLTAIGNERLSVPDLYEVVNRARFQEQPALDDVSGMSGARSDVDFFIQRLGWHVDPEVAGRLAQVVVTLRQLGCECDMDFFGPYAAAAERLVVQELDLLPSDAASTDRAAAVARMVLLDAALATVHRMAQEHFVAQRFDAASPATGETGAVGHRTGVTN